MSDRSNDILPPEVKGGYEQTWFDAALFVLLSQYTPGTIDAAASKVIAEFNANQGS